ncbi:bifunctional 2-polyprenyl-6-hydroxyphenol methylase/3-demethylubiquinol 3-O-methyltransferase UbiG [Egbenema bharatensis]|uniref:bifunctional 2-polyprenyl-6-hydroxyphenol methylase/3-demethylubiquinol 3-O-methyltransferase UbiG n=1 Tax=Egbenema bharatensis TaxID=3463334 RepID=UPI003A87984F
MQRNDLGFYDRSAGDWWNTTSKIYALHHLNAPRFEYFDRHISNWQGLRVLDVGCGGGFSCEFLANRGAIVSGIDQSKPCIETARTHAQQNQLAIDYQHGVAEALPYPDHTFDGVICVDVLEHVANVQKTISEIDRVLKPGGFFCFDTINQTFKSKVIMIWLLENILQEIPRGVHDWQKFIQPNKLSDLMQQVGFTEIEIKGFNIFGSTLFNNIAAYWHYRKTGNFRISLNEDTAVMYIGKARKMVRH